MAYTKTNTQAAIDNSCTLDRHFEITYRDLADLYGPKIWADGIGRWFTYEHLIQIASAHLLSGIARSSYWDMLVFSTRQRATNADLITVITGIDLAAHAQEEYDRQRLACHIEGKACKTVRFTTVADPAAQGIHDLACT
ncbi:MAG: hypothetical protein GY832_18875 [Chloroflexi bacterium]|nr:hypothetical protein [Chloroflexota bacterium]